MCNVLNCNKKRSWHILGVELHSPLNPRNQTLKQFSQLTAPVREFFKKMFLGASGKKL